MSDCSYNLAVYFRIELSAQLHCCKAGEFNRIAREVNDFSCPNRLS